MVHSRAEVLLRGADVSPSTEGRMVNNPHAAKAKKILDENNPGDTAKVEPAELARAQVHATLAVARAIEVIYEAIIDEKVAALWRPGR